MENGVPHLNGWFEANNGDTDENDDNGDNNDNDDNGDFQGLQ